MNSALNGLSPSQGPRQIVYGSDRITGNVMTADQFREYLHRSFDFTPSKPSVWQRVRKFIKNW